MECQLCKSRPATVHLTEILENQEKREVHLCEQCASSQQSPGEDLMSMYLSTHSQLLATSGKAESSRPPEDSNCSACGLTYREFRGRGRMGCPTCYQSFRSHLDPLLEKIHNKTRHVGKTPGEASSADRSIDRRMVELRRRLQEAVASERYEEAASLRDELQSATAAAEREDDADDAGDGPTPTSTLTQGGTDTETASTDPGLDDDDDDDGAEGDDENV